MVKRVVYLSLAVLLLILPAVFLASANPSKTVIIVLDASGSMGKSFEGISRMHAAQYIINEQLAGLDSSRPVGLAAYGNGISGCNSGRVYVPAGTGNRKKISNSVMSMRSSGNSPIQATLQLIEKKILPFEKDAMILLISDGVENCGGNPEEVAEKILRKYPGVRINVIGLSVASPEAAELTRIAGKGNGKFYDVKTTRDSHLAFIDTVGGAVKNVPEDERLEDPGRSNPLLRLKTVSVIEKNADRIKLQITYELSGVKEGNYVINISGLIRESVNPWDEVGQDQFRRIAAVAVPRYGVSPGKGILEVEFPLNNIEKQPILIQGELWDIAQIPDLLNISNKLSVNSR